MPVFLVNRMYKKLFQNENFILILNKRNGRVRKILKLDDRFKYYYDKSKEFYTLKAVNI